MLVLLIGCATPSEPSVKKDSDKNVEQEQQIQEEPKGVIEVPVEPEEKVTEKVEEVPKETQAPVVESKEGKSEMVIASNNELDTLKSDFESLTSIITTLDTEAEVTNDIS